MKAFIKPGILEKNIKKPKKSSPLFEAVSNNQVEVVELLLSSGFKAYYVPSVMKALSNSVMLRLFLEHKLNPNARLAGQLPLSIAVQNGDLEIVKLLLDYGADVNLTDGHSVDTLFDIACSSGKMDVALVLLENGLNASLFLIYVQLPNL